jgi:hypothetical protein
MLLCICSAVVRLPPRPGCQTQMRLSTVGPSNCFNHVVSSALSNRMPGFRRPYIIPLLEYIQESRPWQNGRPVGVQLSSMRRCVGPPICSPSGGPVPHQWFAAALALPVCLTPLPLLPTHTEQCSQALGGGGRSSHVLSTHCTGHSPHDQSLLELVALVPRPLSACQSRSSWSPSRQQPVRAGRSRPAAPASH